MRLAVEINLGKRSLNFEYSGDFHFRWWPSRDAFVWHNGLYCTPLFFSDHRVWFWTDNEADYDD